MSGFVVHQTGANERFDHLAYLYYGDANRTSLIIDANRDVFPTEAPLPAILEAGLTLLIPVIEQDVSNDDLPPWKRGQSIPAGS
jgi:Phage Tail Protein X